MITDSEKLKAIKISQALQDFFNKNSGTTNLRSTDAYEILVTKKLVERDRHCGIKFREFLNYLNKNKALDLIPQCRAVKANYRYTNWFFHSEPNKTISSRNLIPTSDVNKKIILDKSEILKKVNLLPLRNKVSFTPQHIETRETYKRAYEIWTPEEEAMLLDVASELRNLDVLGDLFLRQPSAIKSRLKRLGFGAV